MVRSSQRTPRMVRAFAGRSPEDLIGERTRQINRLRWHLHELDPAWDPPQRSLNRYKQLDEIIARLIGIERLVARLALELAGTSSKRSQCSSGRSRRRYSPDPAS